MQVFTALPLLVYRASNFIVKNDQIDQEWLPLGKSMLTTPDHFL